VNNTILTAFVFSLSTSAFCQSKIIANSLLYEQELECPCILEDSVIKNYGSPLLEVNRFYVTLDKVFFDRSPKVIRIKGKVCFYERGMDKVGIPGVRIFKAEKTVGDSPINIVDLAETSLIHDSSFYNSGLFDIKFKIKKGESLFFYMPHFYIDEFKIGGAIEKAKIRKKVGLFAPQIIALLLL
jgi:hypothetical protein